MHKDILTVFKRVAPSVSDCGYCALRIIEKNSEVLSMARGVLQPLTLTSDFGVMVSVYHRGSFAYAATSDVSEAGIVQAIDRARYWARTCEALSVDYGEFCPPHPSGDYAQEVQQSWDDVALKDKIDVLQSQSVQLSGHEEVVSWEASLWRTQTISTFATNGGGEVRQVIEQVFPSMSVTAHRQSVTVTRSLGSADVSRQGGFEALAEIKFLEQGGRLKEESLALLNAPNCPSGKMDLVLMPNQMMLQIHESIGHPLELDRILGDERNYAGTSFVGLSMFGDYQYGSPLLNVSFDPTIGHELASYAYDDDGQKAEKVMLIEDGVLKQPLGGAYSTARVDGLSGTANARASSWNRPALDRMANLNVEPGEDSFEAIIANTERGVLMDTNCSWSIDDSRNKFQFGCELGRVIEDGELKGLVRNPNYRGVSETFWRNLSAVGNADSFEVLGTPYCGKAEPNQVITVGHAAPVCKFSHVDVFGGEL